MGKGQEGRAKPWSRRWAAAAMAAVFAMTGCVQQTDVPIVSEKTEGTPDNIRADAERGDRAKRFRTKWRGTRRSHERAGRHHKAAGRSA